MGEAHVPGAILKLEEGVLFWWRYSPRLFSNFLDVDVNQGSSEIAGHGKSIALYLLESGALELT